MPISVSGVFVLAFCQILAPELKVVYTARLRIEMSAVTRDISINVNADRLFR
jgi:hypothetical protein